MARGNGHPNSSPNGNGAAGGAELDDAGACRGRRRWFDVLLLVGGLATAVSMRPAMWALVLAVIAATAWGMLWSLVRRAKGDRGGALRVGGQLLIGAAVVGAVALFYLRDPRHAEQIRSFGNAPADARPGYAEEDEMFNLSPRHLWSMARHAVHHVPVFFDAVSKATFGLPLDLGVFDAKWVFGPLVLVLGAGLFFHRPLWGLLVVTTATMVFMVKPLDRYFLPVVPLLVFAWWRFCAAVNRGLPPRWANAAFLVLFLFGAAPNFGKVLGFIREQRHVPFLAGYKDGRYATVYEAADMIAAHTPPSAGQDRAHATRVLVASKFGRIVTYLSDRYAFEPDAHSTLDPSRQPLYVLGSLRSDPRNTNPGGKDAPGPPVFDPTVRGWLNDRHFRCELVACVPTNKGPAGKAAWCALYRVSRDPS